MVRRLCGGAPHRARRTAAEARSARVDRLDVGRVPLDRCLRPVRVRRRRGDRRRDRRPRPDGAGDAHLALRGRARRSPEARARGDRRRRRARGCNGARRDCGSRRRARCDGLSPGGGRHDRLAGLLSGADGARAAARALGRRRDGCERRLEPDPECGELARARIVGPRAARGRRLGSVRARRGGVRARRADLARSRSDGLGPERAAGVRQAAGARERFPDGRSGSRDRARPRPVRGARDRARINGGAPRRRAARAPRHQRSRSWVHQRGARVRGSRRSDCDSRAGRPQDDRRRDDEGSDRNRRRAPACWGRAGDCDRHPLRLRRSASGSPSSLSSARRFSCARPATTSWRA